MIGDTCRAFRQRASRIIGGWEMAIRRLAGLVVIGLLPAAALAGADRLVDSRWYQVESAHFRIITNGNWQKVEKLAGELETFRAVALQLMGREGDAQRLTIIAAADRATYAGLVGDKVSLNTGGIYINTINGSYALINMDERRFYAINPAREFLFHEYTHFLAYGRGAQRYPYWYSEGFAELLSTLGFTEDGRFEIGTPPAYRAATLIHTRPLPIEDLLRLTPQEAHKRERARLYASGWMLAHWLLLSSGKADQFRDYLRAYQGGVDPVAALEKALSMSIAEIETEYLRQFREEFPLRSAPLPADYAASPARVDWLPTDQALAEIGYFLSASPGRHELLYTLLREAREQGKGSAQLIAIQAEAALRAGDLDSASRYLETIPKSERNQPWYRSPRAWWRLQRELHKDAVDRDTFQAIRDEFVFLVNNDDRRASNWYGLALALKTLDYPREKYTEMLEQAYLRAPRETRIAIEFANALYQRRDSGYFSEVANPLLMELEDTEQAKKLQHMLAELQKEESAG